MSKVTVRVPGFGLGTLLGVLFIALKLTGHIDWSWFWVTLPLTFPLFLAFGLFFFAFLISIVQAIITELEKRQ